MKKFTNKYQLIIFQPHSIYGNGGSSRIFRRIVEGKESEVFSIGINTSKYSSNSSHRAIDEVIIPLFPLQRKWMRWYMRTLVIYLRKNIFIYFANFKIKYLLSEIKFDVLHILDQDKIFPIEILKKNTNIKLWVSFHDHFNAVLGNSERTAFLWNYASRRLVISEAMGKEYSRLFGYNTYEIITDGLYTDEISVPKSINYRNEIIIYFAGLLHIDYYDLFRVLSEALDKLSTTLKFKLILRGTQYLNFLDGKKFRVEYLPMTLDNIQLKKELDEAQILYLPIKFTRPDFYLYSLSTKMVGYLGASGTILYHGPDNSAACNLLKSFNASINCVTLKVDDMVDSLNLILKQELEISRNAKSLALQKFNLPEIQKQFWNF
jgi:hypothetical protein